MNVNLWRDECYTWKLYRTTLKLQKRVARDILFGAPATNVVVMDIPGTYTQEEKLHLLANLDIEGSLRAQSYRKHLIRVQSPIALTSSNHGCQIVSKTSTCTKRVRCHEYPSKFGV